jgi:hypothetical protein
MTRSATMTRSRWIPRSISTLPGTSRPAGCSPGAMSCAVRWCTRGQPVEVSAMDGALTVTLRALSLQDAARGESVRVRNLDTNKEFTAVVTAESKAVVSF